MKVAYIEELFHLVPNGGAAVWTRRLTECLKVNGIQIRIFAYSDGIDNRLPDFLNVFPNFREIFLYPARGKKAITAIERQYDLIHLGSPHTMTWAKPTIPCLVSIHYLISRQGLMLGKYLPSQYKVLFNKLSFSLFLHFERKGLEKADAITVSRPAYKEYLIQYMQIPAEKIHIVKYGIDTEYFKPLASRQSNSRLVLFVGRGSLPKGFDTLVAAAPLIQGQILAVATQIPKNLQKKIKNLKNFKILSRISQDHLLRCYQEAQVYVLPSLTESSPVSTLEAMSCGLPVVCTSEGGGEYVENGKNGFIIPFKDPERLAEKVNYLLDHPKVVQEFSNVNRKQVETEFTLTKIASQIKAIYQQLTTQR